MSAVGVNATAQITPLSPGGVWIETLSTFSSRADSANYTPPSDFYLLRCDQAELAIMSFSLMANDPPRGLCAEANTEVDRGHYIGQAEIKIKCHTEAPPMALLVILPPPTTVTADIMPLFLEPLFLVNGAYPNASSTSFLSF